MKKKYLIILLLTMIFIPFKVLAAGGFGVSSTSVSMYPGETKTITISTNNAVGKLNISSSNVGIASVTPGSVFIQNPGASESITITGNSVGTATISVVASDNFATMDEEILAGQTRTITVNVKEKTVPKPSEPTPQPSVPLPQQPQNNLSKNNNIKSLSIEGYDLIKVDNNNYTLTVSNSVTSVSVNATAEDSKAKVSGNGVKELKVGENNIEVIVTSESGAQNKINIKVTRKDGYYLDDLDSVLKDEKLQDGDIIINADTKITKEEITKIKDSKKILRFNYYDENKKLVYSWMLNGKKIKDSKEFLTTISYTSDNVKEIYKLSNYADGLYVNFKHNGELPTGTKIKLYVGDKFENGNILNVYHYNNEEKSLNIIKDGLNVVDGYVEFDLEHCSEYFVTMANIGGIEKIEKSGTNIFLILTIIELVFIIGLTAFIFIKFRPVKKVVSTNNLDTIVSDANNFYKSESIQGFSSIDGYLSNSNNSNNNMNTNNTNNNNNNNFYQ